ncbi:hypothetical protein SEVIR_5G381600v4 [Setaria viridis]|uniref:Homeobox domain-containing protein n=3 Tax=Setaria TaxID=4554 RepID=A0A368RCZ4_SETIT|nr:hypothetical protein SETIT_5G376400v2 [Setaria italica]TKW17640.1 hypothetical protein SEVIR_5G381600v2 [Setaria viridis]
MEAAPQHGGAGVIDLEGSGSGGAPLSPPLSPASAAAAALANARWNPTKEQLAALEGLYEHGLRTPSAEQIKQITARLREHGHIEGKNVFYWFQNHKARQRQKQKQDSFAYFTRLLRRPPPLPMLVRPPGPLPYPHGRLPVPAPPAAAAAACSSSNGGTHVMYRSPFYMPAAPQAPAANALYYHPQHQHQVPASVMYPRMEVAQDKMIPAAAQHNHHHHRHHPAAGAMYHAAAAGNNASTTPMHVLHFPPAAAVDAGPSRETLQLFPLQPTFLLPADKGRAAGGGASMAPAPSTASASFSGESESLEESPDSYSEALAVPFYDFFGLQSGGR